MLKVLIHLHNVILLFNLPLVNYFYLGTTLSHIQKITIHFLWPHTHNCIPGSFYFELTILGKGLSLTCKADCPPIPRPVPYLLLPPFYDSVRPSCLQKSLPWGVDCYQHFHVFSIFYKCTVTSYLSLCKHMPGWHLRLDHYHFLYILSNLLLTNHPIS